MNPTRTITMLIFMLSLTTCKKNEKQESPIVLTESTDVTNIQVFPTDNPWNTDISQALVDPNSNNLIASIGDNTNLHPDFGTLWEGKPIGIPYNVVSGSQEKVNINFRYANESDAGPYPIPANPLIEAGSDKHLLVLDKDNQLLYELFNATRNADNSWNAGSGAVYHLQSNNLRPDFWTSADAAGLPIFSGLVRYDEVVIKGEINHALRFTVDNSRNSFVHPATHAASDNSSTNLPPMGMRVRLKAGFDISNFTTHVQVILKAMKKYGMFVADNGSNWFVSGVPDPRWDDNELDQLKTIKGSNFEVVKMGTVIDNH